MGAISAFSTATLTLKRNGALFGAAFLVTLVSIGPTAVQELLPASTAAVVSLPLSGAMLLVMPFLMGGLLAMAYEGLDGVSRFESFVEGGKRNYLRLFAAMVLFAVLLAALTLVVVVAIVVVAVFVVGTNATGAGGAMAGADPGFGLGLVALLGLAAFLVMLVPTFFLQFYAAAVVVSDLGVVAAFRRSAGLVRRNLVSTLGYTAVTLLVGTVSGIAAVVFALLGNPSGSAATTGALPEVGTGVLAAAAAVAVVVTTAVSAFGATYQVAFYDDLLDSLA